MPSGNVNSSACFKPVSQLSILNIVPSAAVLSEEMLRQKAAIDVGRCEDPLVRLRLKCLAAGMATGKRLIRLFLSKNVPTMACAEFVQTLCSSSQLSLSEGEAQQIFDQLKRLYGTEYQVGSGADLLYEASGASHDFAKGSLNIPYSFLVELRPQNTLHSTGFLLPEAEIMDTAEETWEAVKVVADEILQRFGQFGEERKTWNVSTTTTRPTQQTVSNRSTTTTTTERTTTTAAKRTTKTTEKTKEERRTTKNSGKKGNGKERTTTTRKQAMAHKHTFKPNTSGKTTTAKPKPNSTGAPSSSVRNVKSGAKMGKQRPTASVDSSSAISSAESGSERKTIVNVKICTGGRSGVILPFPSPSPSTTEESAEDGEGEEQGTRTLMEILMPKTPRRLVKCRDWSAYCKWWRMHSLCSDPRVTKMCTLSCLIECQI